MHQISFKKVFIGFLIIFLMSRAYKVISFFSGLEFEGSEILTLQPLRDCSEEGRYIVTLVFFLACFIVVWKFLMSRKK